MLVPIFNEKITEWEKNGFSRPNATQWLRSCRNIEEAKEWEKNGFSAEDAMFFQKIGLTPLEAKEMIMNEVGNALVI